MNRRLYVDLDSLLDTRLSVVSGIDSQAAVTVALDTGYWHREHTDWEALSKKAITNDQFKAAWDQRNTETLANSVVTAIPTVLQQILFDYHKNLSSGAVTDDVSLEVNLAPYDLNTDERDGLEEIIRELLFDDLSITFCYRPLTELTPEVIYQRYSAMVMFEFHNWIRLHHELLMQRPCKEVSFIVPRLFERNPEVLNRDGKEAEISLFRMAMLDHMNVEFIAVEWFSMLRVKPTPSKPSP